MINRTRLVDRRQEIGAPDRRSALAGKRINRIAAIHGAADNDIAVAVVDRDGVRSMNLIDRHQSGRLGAKPVDVHVAFGCFEAPVEANVARIGENRCGRA